MSSPRGSQRQLTTVLIGTIEPIRGAYGVLQLAAPGFLAPWLLGYPLDRPGRAATRVLGARQLVQAIASGHTPHPPPDVADSLNRLRTQCADRLARLLVPGYLPASGREWTDGVSTTARWR